MIKRFLLLNGIATIGVVMNHAAGWGYVALLNWAFRYIEGAPELDYSQINSFSYYGLRTIEQLIAFSIAAFLVVSGFFIAFAARQHASLSWKTIRTRILYLLIPYLIWSILIFLLEALQGEVKTLRIYLFELITGNVTDGYYYVPMLIQMFLLAPLLVRVARWNWKVLLVITAIIQSAIQFFLFLDTLNVVVPDFLMFWTKSWLFPGNLFWFTFGIIIGFNLKSFKAFANRTKRWWLVTAVVLIPIGIAEWEALQSLSGSLFLPTRLTLLDSFYAAAVIISFLGYEKATIPRTNDLSDLGTKSFGVYLVNSPVLEFTARAIAVLIPFLLAYQFIFQPILWVAGLTIPLLLMMVVGHPKSPIRSYYQYIFG